MKKVRILAFLLACVLLAALAGCKTTGGNDATAKPGTTELPTEEPTEAPTEAPETGIDEPLDLPYAAAYKVSKVFTKNLVVQ
ncbi:MAG: hypothetical protein J6X19_04565, partial [Clostridia bacterium]|nr:hypothetical protein [Clostridia bacterium]